MNCNRTETAVSILNSNGTSKQHEIVKKDDEKEEEEERNQEENEKENKERLLSLCVINRYMLSSKCCYFFENAKQSCYIPYMLLFYMSIGVDQERAGQINGFRYIGYIIGAPLFGYMADKTKLHRTLITLIGILAIMTMCAQPLLSIIIGEEGDNVCPSPKQFNSTLTKNDKITLRENRLFYVLLCLSIIATSFDGSTQSFVDAGVMKKITNSPELIDFGKQRYFGAVGFGCGAFISSIAIDWFPASNTSCYTAVFCVYFGFTFCLTISSNTLYKGATYETINHQNEENVKTILKDTLLQIHTVFYLLSVLIVGIFHAFYMSFLFVYLKEMNAPNIIMGLSITIGAVSAVTCFTFSMQIIQIFGGTIHTMCLGCFSWCLRFLCNYYITKPEFVLFTQLFHAFGFALFITAAIQHVKNISPPSILATMYGIMNSLFFGAAFIIANVMGGSISKAIGIRNLFLAISIASGVWTLVMMAYICCQKNTCDKTKHEKMCRMYRTENKEFDNSVWTWL